MTTKNKQRFEKEYLKLKQHARAYHKYIKLNKINSCEVQDVGKIEGLNHGANLLGFEVWEK